MKFVVDTMLEKLARWLRILGYDTTHSKTMSFRQLVEVSNVSGAVFLTKRKTLPDGVNILNVKYIPFEKFEDQLRFVVEHFHLDINRKLFTRCLQCNIEVVKVDKSTVDRKVPQQSYIGFDEFFQCPNCNQVYWGGAHLTNTKKKLEQIFKQNL
ncbi:MAG: Mut7-C RNAse domain-containing protein [Bacteroidota bacterium]|nr:Mut7-C RNAse domain-containing protein [Bacteroidota bacterium]